MRTVLILLAITLSVFDSKGQGWRIGAVGQPCLTYYSILGGGNPGYISDFRAADKPIITYQAGLLFLKKMSDKVDFVTGLIYAQHGIQSQYSNSNIYALSFSPGYSLKVIDRYLQIPLYANVYLKKSTFSWFFTVGIKPAVYLNSYSKASGPDTQTGSFRYGAHRKVNIFAVLGIGAELRLANHLQLQVWPVLEHALVNEVFAQPLSVYPYSAGINVSLLYSLGI